MNYDVIIIGGRPVQVFSCAYELAERKNRNTEGS